MRLARYWLVLLVSVFAVACGRNESSSLPSKGDAPSPSPIRTAAISDAVHTSGTPGFYFLFPMVAPPRHTGTFRAGLEPVVSIEELSPGTRGTIATYTTSGGPYGGRVFELGESYNVLWPTAPFALNPAYTYRIHVSVGGFELGYADVDVVRRLRELLTVDTGEYVPLLDDLILPIRFRVEPEALKCVGVVCSPVDQCHVAGACDVGTGLCSNPPKPDNTACDDGNACGHPAACQAGACVGASSSCIDLRMMSLAGAPSSVVAGGSFSVSSTVAATGTGSSGTFQVAFHLSRTATVAETDPLVGTVSVSGLASGASRTDVVTLMVPADLTPAEYWLGAIVDSANQEAEPDETNNNFVATSLTVLGPDLALSALSAPPGIIGVGDSFEVTDTVILDAAGPAVGLFTIHYYLSDGAVLGPTALPIGARTVAGLVPGQQDTASTLITVPTSVPPGTYQFIAAADPEGLVLDRDVANNTVVAGTILVGAYSCQNPPSPIDDGNPCTDDSCDPISGVRHAPVAAGTSCSDGNACNGFETCNGAGSCVAGTPPVVDDGNPCTADSCDPMTGVRHVPVPAGSSCSDGNACNGLETCDGAGACVAGTPLVVDDGNPCTIDSCDPALGAVHTPATAGTSCSDGNACNGEETCNGAGACVAGAPPSLDDGNACTADSCIPSTGVVHSPIPGCGVLPPDPVTVAPPNDPTVATDIASATAFLYTGSNPIQTGVADGTIEARRVAVIRGLVKQRDGNPVGGVTVTIVGHTEFGQTLTRADGMFDIAVNGGGLLTLNYQKDGYLPVQRQVQAPWRDYVWADEVVLVAFDTVISTVVAGSPVTQVARGSPVTDADGSRQATLLFSPGTQASMVMSGGTRQPLSVLHVRATEYTVGPEGPKAMPAALPPTSGYTYAVELSVDEAVMAGATSVEFDRPVAFYVENFRGFPVGGIVPAGYYDRARAVWVPSDNGRVVKVVNVANGLADLDIDGDGASDGEAALAAQGITVEERAQLATTYQPGVTLWRVPVTHLSPWDCNWPYGCTAGADGKADCEAPTLPDPVDPQPRTDSCETSGSRIECQNQVLGEELPITGTPFTLHYRSDRVKGRTAESRIRIPLSGSSLPRTIRRIDLDVEIAGRRFHYSAPPIVNHVVTFEWDGTDSYGRLVQGTHQATVRVGYAYSAVRLQPAEMGRSFAALSWSGQAVSGITTEIILWQVWKMNVASFRWPIDELGGWSLDVHHRYDPESRTLVLGDGSVRSASAIGQVINTVAGGGSGLLDGGGPATGARLNHPTAIAFGEDGSLFIADWKNGRVRKVDSNGTITTVAGGASCTGQSTEGVPATSICMSPMGVAVGSDGSLFIADMQYMHSGIWRVDRDGLIHAFAGGGTTSPGDGGPATQAQIIYASSVAVGPDGSVYFVDESRVRRVTPDGMISTVAGPGSSGADGIPATRAWILTAGNYGSVSVGQDGSIYLPSSDGRRIRRIGTDGIIRAFAGTYLPGFSGDGSPALEAQFQDPRGAWPSSDGSVLIADRLNNRIRMVGRDWTISTVAGSGVTGSAFNGFSGDGGPALLATLSAPWMAARGPDGDIYIVDSYNNRIRRVERAFPRAALYLPSSDARELYEFDSKGRHLRTVSAITGATLLQFGYEKGLLSSITDGDGNVTHIQRDAGGKPLSIVAPRGQVTTVTIGDDRMMSAIANPAGETSRMSYYPGGLLERLVDPRGHVHRFYYDSAGRLTRDENPAGGFKTLSRSEADAEFTVSLSTALGRTSTYDVQSQKNGIELRTNTSPGGRLTVEQRSPSATVTSNLPGGTVVTTQRGPDPRFKMEAPVFSRTIQTPAGRSLSVAETRTAASTDPGRPLNFTSLGQTLTVNGRSYTTSYTAATLTSTSTTPAGRTSTTVFDAKGRVVELRPPGVRPIGFQYDSHGRLITATQGDRSYGIGYDAQGYPHSLTDPLSRSVSLTYDLAGRVQTQTLPGGRTVTYGYDASGNMTSLAPPSRPAHGFGYTGIDLVASYTPPAVSNTGLVGTTYSYDLDGALSQVLLPDEGIIVPGYDAAGRLSTVTTARGTMTLGYDVAGRVSTLTAPDSGLAYTYDGFLKTSETWSGSTSGVVSWTYDNDFRVATTSVNGNSVSYQYDLDSLLTGAGSLSITRESATGRISGSTLGTVTTTQSYNEYGELASFSGSSGGSSAYSYTLSRDPAGRITGKTETVQGATDTYAYGYDDAGRLATVTKNGEQTASYVYDDNGNRLSGTSSGGAATGAFDTQDRMTAYGSATYTYGANGDLRTKTLDGHTTTYSYDALGNLMAVWLPDGRVIEYVVDGFNRRVGKKVNGGLAEGFLYDGQLRPVAWLDDSGAVKATFVYGLHVNVPEYMTTPAGTFRFVHDHLGSPRLVVDSRSGAVVQRMDYDSFGQVLADTNPGFQPFGFAGGLYDRDTGLVRFGARDFDPSVGRWTNKDPIRFSGGTTNLYEYVGNDPVNWRDPSGLWAGGISFEFSTINPFTSGGGGSYGVNIEYTSDAGWHVYTYATPNDLPSQGFLVGPSVQFNLATGNGDWTGPFDSGAGSFGVITGGYFQSPADQPDPGYFGLSLGIGKGPPGLGFTRTVYRRMFPDKAPCK